MRKLAMLRVGNTYVVWRTA